MTRVNYSQGEVPSRVAGFVGLNHIAHFCCGRTATHPRKKKKKPWHPWESTFPVTCWEWLTSKVGRPSRPRVSCSVLTSSSQPSSLHPLPLKSQAQDRADGCTACEAGGWKDGHLGVSTVLGTQLHPWSVMRPPDSLPKSSKSQFLCL